MPTILHYRNIKFVVYARDHYPAHVHAISPQGEAKIDIDSAICFYSRGYTKRDVKMIEKFVEKKKKILMEAWNEYYS